MRTAYGHVETAQNLGVVEIKDSIKGQLLQYMALGVIYFELIYRVENFFLHTVISTPVSVPPNNGDFNVDKNYILKILQGIRTQITR